MRRSWWRQRKTSVPTLLFPQCRLWWWWWSWRRRDGVNFLSFAHSLFEQIMKHRMWRRWGWRWRRLRRRRSCEKVFSFSSLLLVFRQRSNSFVDVSGTGDLVLLLPLSLIRQNRSPNHRYLLLHITLPALRLRPNPNWRWRGSRPWRRRRWRRRWRSSNVLNFFTLFSNMLIHYFLRFWMFTSKGLIRPSRIFLSWWRRRWRCRCWRLLRRGMRRVKYESIHRNLLNYI